jgi:hypothetical protein
VALEADRIPPLRPEGVQESAVAGPDIENGTGWGNPGDAPRERPARTSKDPVARAHEAARGGSIPVGVGAFECLVVRPRVGGGHSARRAEPAPVQRPGTVVEWRTAPGASASHGSNLRERKMPLRWSTRRAPVHSVFNP